MNTAGLPPRVLVWAPDADEGALGLTLQQLMREPDRWAGVDVFSPAATPGTAGGTWWVERHGERQLKQQVTWHGPAPSWEAALRRVGLPEGVPLAWLAAGTRVPIGWTVPLQAALQREPGLGTCSPMGMGDPLHAPFFDATKTNADVDALSAWLGVHAPTPTVELGVPLACAGVMRHEAWRAACVEREPASAGADVPWALEVARAGWVHGTSRQVVVAVTHTPSETTDEGRALTLLAHETLWHAAHPLTGVRHALSQHDSGAWTRRDSPMGKADGRTAAGGAAPPVRLHVMHSWGGGLSKWVGDFCRADAQAGTGRNLLLKSIGTYGAFAQRLELHADHDGGAPLEVWELGLPIHATALAHGQVQRILDELMQRYGVSEVIVSSLIGQSLDVLRTGLPTVLVMHDHHPFCVTLYAHFESECRQCDGQRLGRCMRENPGHRFFQGVRAEDWLALREAFVDTVVRHRPLLVAPSPSVADRWRALMPGLAQMPMQVIEHGLSLAPAPEFTPPSDGPLRVVVLGRLTAEKGRSLLAEIVPALEGKADVLLMGCGDQPDPLKSLPHVTAVDHFDGDELPALLAAWRPHVGLLLSTVPETFSYALSELWHTRIPVLACANGALADRICDGDNGFLVEPQAAAVLGRLADWQTHRDALEKVRRRLAVQPTRDLQAMVGDYLKALGPMPRRRPTEAQAEALVPLGPPTEAALRGPERWLHVSAEATWWQACLGFWTYTLRKAANSPRLPSGVRQGLLRRLTR